MKIAINGKSVETQHRLLLDIVEEFGASGPYALAVNGDFVPKSQYPAFEVNPGDLVDIVSPIFGG